MKLRKRKIMGFIKKSVSSMLVLTVLLSGIISLNLYEPAAVSSASYWPTGTMKVNSNVWGTPYDGAANIGSVNANESVYVLETEGSRTYIEYSTASGTKRGYVATVNLNCSAAIPAAKNFMDYKTGYASEQLDVYAGPTTFFVKLGLIYEKEQIRVLRNSNEFYFIEYNTSEGKKRGFVHARKIHVYNNVAFCAGGYHVNDLTFDKTETVAVYDQAFYEMGFPTYKTTVPSPIKLKSENDSGVLNMESSVIALVGHGTADTINLAQGGICKEISMGNDYYVPLPIFDMRNVSLIIFQACSTASNNDNNIANKAVSLGATTSIGFTGEIMTIEGLPWSKYITKHLAEGLSIKEACLKSVSYPDVGSYKKYLKIYGDPNNRIRHGMAYKRVSAPVMPYQNIEVKLKNKNINKVISYLKKNHKNYTKDYVYNINIIDENEDTGIITFEKYIDNIKTSNEITVSVMENKIYEISDYTKTIAADNINKVNILKQMIKSNPAICKNYEYIQEQGEKLDDVKSMNSSEEFYYDLNENKIYLITKLNVMFNDNTTELYSNKKLIF